jgi:hypothetical protein
MGRLLAKHEVVFCHFLFGRQTQIGARPLAGLSKSITTERVSRLFENVPL